MTIWRISAVERARALPRGSAEVPADAAHLDAGLLIDRDFLMIESMACHDGGQGSARWCWPREPGNPESRQVELGRSHWTPGRAERSVCSGPRLEPPRSPA